MNKWVCKRCNRERTDKPNKNEICNKDGCKGRFLHFARCKVCGEWFPTNGATVCGSCAERGFKRSHGRSVSVVCEYCGRSFQRPKANARGKKQFCNIECMRMYEKTRWVERKCIWCGKTFKIRKSTILSTNATGNYCSKECYDNAKHKEGSASWRDGFERIKRKHFGSSQFCAICGTTKNIHIHHIIPFRLTHDNGIDNLIPLCASHHAKVKWIWKPFIETFDNPNDAKPYIRLALCARQLETAKVLESIIHKRR